MIVKVNIHKTITSLFLHFILFVLSGSAFYVQAQNKVVFNSSSKSVALENSVSVFFDENASLSINDIQKIYKNAPFSSKLKDIPGYSKSAVWLAVEIENKTQEKIYLEVKPLIINHVSMFTVLEGKVIDSLTIGSLYAFDDRPVKTKNFVFELKPGLFTYFIRVTSDTYLPFSVNLLDERSLYSKEHFWGIVNALLFGALILTILYNLLLYFSVRDPVYLYYLVLVFLSALALLYHFGIGNYFSLGNHPIFSKHITALYGLVNISTVLFVIKVMDLSVVMPKMFRALQIVIALVGGIIFIDLLGFAYEANLLLMFMFGFSYFFIFIIAILLIKKGDIATRLFSVSWLILIIAFVVFIMQNLHLFSLGNGSFDLLVYGGYVNIIMLSLVVGNKLNIYRKNEEKARYKELVALQERDGIISTQKIKLEQTVQERNSEIISKNEELLAQQNEIESQINAIEQKNIEINEINNKLQSKNRKIEEQNVILEKNRNQLEKTVELRTKELVREKERAIAADNLKTSFLSNLSREIKTPMNAITGYATLIMNKSILIEQRNEYLQIIIQNVDALLSLIDDIVTLSRIQAGIVKLRTREIDLVPFVRLVADEFNQKLLDSKNKDVVILPKIPDNNADSLIKSDYNKLWSIYKQLMENALKFTEKGVVSIGFEIKGQAPAEQNVESENLQQNMHSIQFFVDDTGKGMSHSDIQKYIIDRNTNVLNYNYKQGGLGLAIVTGLVDVFKGKINVISEKGKGTRFEITISAELIT